MRPVTGPELGARIAAAREVAGKTQTQVAEELGVKQPTVCGWEKGDFEPRPKLWASIAAALNTEVSDLFFVADPPAAANG